MNVSTDYGKEIKKRLIDIDRNQAWLIEQVKERTDLFFDSSYLYKIVTGSLKTPKIVAAINEILNIEVSDEEEQ